MNDKYATIIDWGLSVIYKPNEIPEKLQGRSVYYNIPFTSILFNSVFDNMYSTFLPTHFNIFKWTLNKT